MQVNLVVLAALMAIGGPAIPKQSATAPSTSSGPVVQHCLVSLIEEVQLPGGEPGPLASLEAKEGMQVKAGTTLGHIDDSAPSVEKKVKMFEAQGAKQQAENDVNVRYARAAADVANAELQKALEAIKRVPGSIAQVEVNRLRLTYVKAKLQIEQAQQEQSLAGITAEGKNAEVDAAELSIERRRIKSPIDGVVTNVYRHVGEWVAPGDPVLKIVRVDRLRVEGFLNVADYNAGEIDGRAVTVEVELAQNRKMKYAGKIVFVSPLVQAGGEYRVFAEVNNKQENGQWILRPGLIATMTIHLK